MCLVGEREERTGKDEKGIIEEGMFNPPNFLDPFADADKLQTVMWTGLHAKQIGLHTITCSITIQKVQSYRQCPNSM